MWYQNIGIMFLHFVTKHACDDSIATRNTALALLRRAVKIDRIH